MAMEGRRWRMWVLGWGVWTALALLSAMQNAVFFLREGRPVPWPQVLTERFADWYTCALFTPLFFWLVRAVPWDRQRWWRPVGIQALVVLACVPIKYVLYLAILESLPAARPRTYESLLLGNFISETMAFGAMLAIIHAVEFQRRVTEQRTREARLEARLAEARLAALTAQLQPHFLFNTLHAISALMHRNVEAADRMLARLGDLLRSSLAAGDTNELPLEEELRLLDAYLDIARVRFADRLTIAVDVPPETRRALVPRFILQPLVENALQHGIGSREGAGCVRIEARNSGGRLRLTVADNGSAPSLSSGTFPREGIGLTNTRERLRERYGADHEFLLQAAPDGGLVATMNIPFRELAPAG
jgi:two-component system, LytTR family, sensor kinase